jgi:hypothetical protein
LATPPCEEKTHPDRLRVIRDITVKKIEIAKTNIATIDKGEFADAPVMKFPVSDLQALQKECLDLPSADEINALDALIYWLEAIDGVFEGVGEKGSGVFSRSDTTSSLH